MSDILSVAVFKAKDSIPLYFAPTQDGIPVTASTYAANAAIDGTLGNLKCQISVYDSTGTVATTFDGTPMNAVTMFKHPTELYSYVFTCRKGFNPSVDTTYTAVAWYDSTSGANGLRIKGTMQFKIRANTNADTPPSP